MTTPYDPHGMDPQNRAFDQAQNEAQNEAKQGPDGAGYGADHGAGHGIDETALRRLLRDAVQHVEPAPDALDQLRRAIPARKAHRRQALAGAAAAVLLVCTAVPALLHAANTAGEQDGRSASASSAHDPDLGNGGGPDGGQDTQNAPTGSATGDSQGHGANRPSHTPGPSFSPGVTASASASGSGGVTAPTCSRGQLGAGTGSTGKPDTSGRVYGRFRVSNVSKANCAVTGGGAVTVTAQGSADPSKIQVLDHTAGDPATGLPAVPAGPLVLRPGQAYEVQFAWIPASGGGTSGCGAAPSPSSSPSTATGGSAGTGSTGTSPAAADSTPPPAPPSIAISHTPDAGSPAAADTTIPDACAGTVYRTTAALAPQ